MAILASTSISVCLSLSVSVCLCVSESTSGWNWMGFLKNDTQEIWCKNVLPSLSYVIISARSHSLSFRFVIVCVYLCLCAFFLAPTCFICNFFRICEDIFRYSSLFCNWYLQVWAAVCVYVWVCYFVCAPSQVESISLLLSRVALDHTNKNKAATTTKIEEQL